MSDHGQSLPHTNAAGDSVPQGLHNYGPYSNTVYRTARVGQTYDLDLLTLLAMGPMPGNLRRPVRFCLRTEERSPDPRDCISPDQAYGIVSFLLGTPALALSATERAAAAARAAAARPAREFPNVTERALAKIVELRERLAALGLLSPFHGLATVQGRTGQRVPARDAKKLEREWPWLPGGDQHGILRLAWSVCAISHLSPPLVRWTRPPSLFWWRGDEIIELRWFGREGAPAAREVLS
jgi:hypothetical protein